MREWTTRTSLSRARTRPHQGRVKVVSLLCDLRDLQWQTEIASVEYWRRFEYELTGIGN